MQKFHEFKNIKDFERLVEEKTTSLLTEGGLARIWQHLQNRNVGVVTAFRGRYTLQENRKRNIKLESLIRAAGFGYYKAEGHYIENYGTDLAQDKDEEVFFVVGDEEDDDGKMKGLLYKWGKEFRQDSVLYKGFGEKAAMLIGCQNTDEDGNQTWPGDRKEISVGDWHPQKLNMFYTKMKGKVFAFFESVKVDPGFFGSWGKHLS